MPGQLYVVATPIGNLEDLTLRAIQVLKDVDIIAAEDTRRARQLLNHLNIGKKQLISYYDQVEAQKSSQLVANLLNEHQSMALISDAGTPCISDPGFRLVAAARAAGVSVVPIPGVSALTTLVSVAGLPSDRFTFVGFLPTKDKALRAEMQSWSALQGCVIFYESPRRLTETLTILNEIFPAAQVSVGRELTKLHEEIVTRPVAAMLQWSQGPDASKGEAVVMVELPAQSDAVIIDWDALTTQARTFFSHGGSVKDAVQIWKATGLARSELYDFMLKVKKDIDHERE